jgi:hypothetical protein
MAIFTNNRTAAIAIRSPDVLRGFFISRVHRRLDLRSRFLLLAGEQMGVGVEREPHL